MRPFVAGLTQVKPIGWTLLLGSIPVRCSAAFPTFHPRLYVKHPLLATLTRIFGVGAVMLLGGCNMEILSPKGDIGAQEKTLLFTATGLMLLVVIPVIIMVLTFAWKYRASNTKAEYQPKWAHSTAIEGDNAS